MSVHGRNFHACLVHEKPECVADLVANLRCLDPEATVLLYDGSRDRSLLRSGALRESEGVLVHAEPKEMSWGRLHDFALDCLRLAMEYDDFAALTIVDSDQLAVRPDYSRRLAEFLDEHPRAGCLVSRGGGVQPQGTLMGPARDAWRELSLWRPWLNRFPEGERRFPAWTFWPSTVITRAAAADILEFADDPELVRILKETRVTATEEVLFPTLTALAGHEILQNPCSTDYVRFRVAYSTVHVDRALARPDVFWMHPVPRDYGHRVRTRIRSNFHGYSVAAADAVSGGDCSPLGVFVNGSAAAPLLTTLPLLDRMEGIEGWFSRAEGDLLIATAVQALTVLPAPRTVVEVGSYCGRSTVLLAAAALALDPQARVYAVDPHEGTVGAAGARLTPGASTWERFHANIVAAGVDRAVVPIKKCSFDVDHQGPISMLFIDGLHDCASVAQDYCHFQQHLVDGALIAFHDYADYYPGVRAVVDHLVMSKACVAVQRSESLAVLRKTRDLPLPLLHPVLELMETIDGWFRRDEAAYLALVAAAADEEGVFVEVGSYCGRATVVLGSVARARQDGTHVVAVDTFDGTVGAVGVDLHTGKPTYERFTATIASADLDDVVETVRARASDLAWGRPVSLLLVDGLHDYASVSADFASFARHVVAGGYAAFHDYADYYPGVKAFVTEMLRQGGWTWYGLVGSLAVLRRDFDEARPR
ncbi:class I SAM-dependent methyltransferase [Streptomyces sp. NPDC059916]|uniref:class I SAM-dependent methyltransferase n=1 Tax=Streptomyces sp. NPDC059916 TaxID=3347001 RepID=UPI0036ACBF45